MRQGFIGLYKTCLELDLVELYLYGKNIEDDYEVKIDSHLERAFYWTEFVRNSKNPLI